MAFVLHLEGVRHGILNVVSEEMGKLGVDAAARVCHPLDQKGEIVFIADDMAAARGAVRAACANLLSRIETPALEGGADHTHVSLVRRDITIHP